MSDPTVAARADVCVTAIADLFRGDGEILCNPIGVLPRLGGKLARATHAPDLQMLEQDALFVDAAGAVEGWNPYRRMFDVIWRGRRHVVMGASQLDRYGNQNLAAVGPDPTRPTRQLLGLRGAPGNTVSHATSYWVGAHSRRVFVPEVDLVCGIGTDRAAGLGAAVRGRHDLRGIVTDLAVLDLAGPDGRMRLVSVHPGVEVEQVLAATGFELHRASEVPVTRSPDATERQVIDALDPDGLRYTEVAA